DERGRTGLRHHRCRRGDGRCGDRRRTPSLTEPRSRSDYGDHMTAAPENGSRPPAAPRTILRAGDVVTQPGWPGDRDVRSVHVVRSGGAGVSAVARRALESGLAVSGAASPAGRALRPLTDSG